MASTTANGTSEGFVVINGTGGLIRIPSPAVLQRLNYFDGKFLRAADLTLEQQYVRTLVSLSNQAGGAGIAHGFDTRLSGASLLVGPGLAIDRDGRVLATEGTTTLGIADLIAAAQEAEVTSAEGETGTNGFGECVEASSTTTTTTTIDAGTLYLLCIEHAEAYCGTEDVAGNICSEACITETARPYVIAGVKFRLVPLNLALAPITSAVIVSGDSKYRRSRVASAYYAAEGRSSLISGTGLRSAYWCAAALEANPGCVALGVLGLTGSSTVQFFDAWTARRERMETPPRHYWAWRMAMRPWHVFLAQVLQFQCQLRDCLAGDTPGDDPGDEPDCDDLRELLEQTKSTLDRTTDDIDITVLTSPDAIAGAFSSRMGELKQLRAQLDDVEPRTPTTSTVTRRLIQCGILELPSGGYLPVDEESSVSVNDQVRAWMGEGVDLRFCIVRPDFVAHALEEVQHMERIPLLPGIEDVSARPEVDILVPDGMADDSVVTQAGIGYAFRLAVTGLAFARLRAPLELGASEEDAVVEARLQSFWTDRSYHGAARHTALDSGGTHFVAAAKGQIVVGGEYNRYGGEEAVKFRFRRPTDQASMVWMELRTERDPAALQPNQSTTLRADVIFGEVVGDGDSIALRATFDGFFLAEMRSSVPVKLGLEQIQGRFTGTLRITEDRFSANLPPSTEATVNVNEECAVFTGASDLASVIVAILKDRKIIAERKAEGGSAIRTEISAQRGIGSDNPTRIGYAEATEAADAEALVSGPAHDDATSAIQGIAMAMRVNGFAVHATSLLFEGTTASVEGSRQIFATRDWVLFHRRRTKDCGDTTIAPAVAHDYRIYAVRVPGEDDADRVQRALAEGSIAGLSYSFLPISTISYPATSSIPSTSSGELRTDWQSAVGTDVEVIHSAIASIGDAAGVTSTLGESRVDQYGYVIDTVASVNLQDVQTLSGVPTDLNAEGYDGVIVMTAIEIATECHRVWYVDPDSLEKFDGVVDGTDDPEGMLRLFAEAGESTAKYLGEVEFKAGVTTPHSGTEDIVAAWPSGETLAETRLVVGPTTPADPALDDESRTQQIGALVGTATGTKVLTANNDFAPCGRITILSPAPRVETSCQEVFWGENDAITDIEMFAKLLADGHELALSVLKQHSSKTVIAHFDGETFTHDDPARGLQAMSGEIAAHLQHGFRVIGAVTITKDGSASNATTDTHVAQGMAVLTELGIDTPPEPVSGVEMEGDCPAVTVVMLAQSVDRVRVLVAPARGAVVPREGTIVGGQIELDKEGDGNVRRNARYHETLTGLLRHTNETPARNVHLVLPKATEDPPQDDPRLLKLVAALKESGVITEETQIKARKATNTERRYARENGFEDEALLLIQPTGRRR